MHFKRLNLENDTQRKNIFLKKNLNYTGIKLKYILQLSLNIKKVR